MTSLNRNMNSSNQLMLLRHAKSVRDGHALADIDRKLSPRGHRAAKAMGQAIAREELIPDLVLCSPARRAEETWRLVSRELPGVLETRTIDSLYDFGDGSRLLEAIREYGGNARALLLVGHNPSMEELAKRLIGEGSQSLRQRLEDKFPTGSMAVIEFRQLQWCEIPESMGQLTHFIRPADVMEEP